MQLTHSVKGACLVSTPEPMKRYKVPVTKCLVTKCAFQIQLVPLQPGEPDEEEEDLGEGGGQPGGAVQLLNPVDPPIA
jgi:hypothetical protein